MGLTIQSPFAQQQISTGTTTIQETKLQKFLSGLKNLLILYAFNA